MAMEQDLRPRFFEDQYLGADDLNLAIEHGRVHAGRHALGGHTWGIALGLDVRETQRANGEINVYVSPGYAWDGFGRPIVALESAPLTASLFESFPFSQGLDGGTPEGRLFAVWVRYSEQATQGPLPGFESCENGGQQQRIQETFQFEVTVYQPAAPFPIVGQEGEIVVDGVSVEAKNALTVRLNSPPLPPLEIDDGSIPFQVFPQANEAKQWLIPLGVVRWKPQTQGQAARFIARTEPDKETSLKVRRYIGVVAESVQAPEGHIRLKARKKSKSPVWSDDLVWVEGKLRVHGDTRLLAGALHLRNQNNDDGDFPVTLQRTANVTNNIIQVVLGNKADGNNRFSIGPDLQGNVAEKFVVQDNGDVGIGTVAPQAALDVSGNRLSRHYVDGSQGQGVVGSFRGGATEPKDGLARARLVIEGGTDKTSPSLDLRINDPSGNIRGTHLYYVPTNYWPSTPEHFGIWTHGMGTALAVQSATNNIGIGTTKPAAKLTIESREHINVLLDRVDTQDHMTLTVGSAGTGIHFGNSNRFFISADPYANRNTARFGNEVLTILGSGNVGLGTSAPAVRLDLADGGAFVQHPFGGGGGGRGLEVGSQGTATSALPNGRIGFPGYGIQHGQIRWIPITGSLGRFELVDSSMNSPSGDYGIAPSLVGLRVARLGTNIFDPYSGYPIGWGGGVHTLDLYAEGSIGVGVNGSLACVMDRNGNLRINGTARKPGGGSWTNSCDQRLKKNIRPLTKALERLLRLKGVAFEWREPEKYGNLVGQQIGLIAQEVEKVFPGWVGTDEEGFKDLTIRGFEALTVEALKEISIRIESLETAVHEMKQKSGASKAKSSRNTNAKGDQ